MAKIYHLNLMRCSVVLEARVSQAAAAAAVAAWLNRRLFAVRMLVCDLVELLVVINVFPRCFDAVNGRRGWLSSRHGWMDGFTTP